MRCKAYTKWGTQCLNAAKHGDYCGRHIKLSIQEFLNQLKIFINKEESSDKDGLLIPRYVLNEIDRLVDSHFVPNAGYVQEERK